MLIASNVPGRQVLALVSISMLLACSSAENDAAQGSGGSMNQGGTANGGSSTASGAGGGAVGGGGGGGSSGSGGSSGTAALGGGGAGGTSVSSEPPGPVVPAFWNTSTMLDETMFFIQQTGAASATANLLFAPDAITSIRSSDGKTTFVENTDFTWTPGTREISLTAASAIPSKTYEEMHPPYGSPGSQPAADGQSGLFFSEGHVFHDLQVTVTYEHQETWEGIRPAYAGESLPNTMSKLEAKSPLSLVMLGDSISQGYNASGFIMVEPFSPPYIDLVAGTLSDAYGSEVNVTNLAQAGQASTWGVTMVDSVVAAAPDLVVLAFGMNADASVEIFKSNIAAIVAGVKAASPSTEFILVGTMAGNPEWTGGNAAYFPQSRDALATMTGPGIVLADVTGVWIPIEEKKAFWDLTGNGVNHPNDFGHRLYAQVITSLLLAN